MERPSGQGIRRRPWLPLVFIQGYWSRAQQRLPSFVSLSLDPVSLSLSSSKSSSRPSSPSNFQGPVRSSARSSLHSSARYSTVLSAHSSTRSWSRTSNRSSPQPQSPRVSKNNPSTPCAGFVETESYDISIEAHQYSLPTNDSTRPDLLQTQQLHSSLLKAASEPV